MRKLYVIFILLSLQACIQNSSVNINGSGGLTLLSNLIYEECLEAGFDQYSDSSTEDIRLEIGDIGRIPQYKVFLCGTGSSTDPYRIAYQNGLRFLMGKGVVSFTKSSEYLTRIKDKSYVDFWGGGYHFKLIGFDDTLMDFAQTDATFVIQNVFSPIGSESIPFRGSFDGNGIVIKNLSISGADNVGFFGVTQDATLKNIHLKNIQVSGRGAVGGLVGLARNTQVMNSYVSWEGEIQSSEVIGEQDVGGLVGFADNTSIVNSYSFNIVKGIQNMGGLVGRVRRASDLSLNHSTISASFTRSLIFGIFNPELMNIAIGGLVGVNEGGRISDTYSFTTLRPYFANPLLSRVGGVIGSNMGSGLLTGANYFYSNYLSCTGHGDLATNCTHLGTYSDFSLRGNFNFLGDSFVWATQLSQLPLLKYNCSVSLPKIFKEKYLCEENRVIATPKEIVMLLVDLDSDGLIEISTSEDLNKIRYNLRGTSFKESLDAEGSSFGCPALGCHGYELVSDIDFANTRWGSAYIGSDKVIGGWEPLGSCGVDNNCEQHVDNLPFVATFEGNGFRVKNIYINRPTQNGVGLFGLVSNLDTLSSNARVSRIFVDKIFILGRDNVGGLLGYQNSGMITNSHVTGNVWGHNTVGGLVGYQNGNITDSSAITALVLGTQNDIGGLVGVSNARIQNSYANGLRLTGLNRLGGLVGELKGASIIEKSWASLNAVSGHDSLGGLVGYQNSGSILNSYASGSTMGNNNIGGLVGTSSGLIENSYANGPTSGATAIGGLVGKQEGTGPSFTHSYALGSVSGSSQVGGLVGWQVTGDIKNSYATGRVNMLSAGGVSVGGLVGATNIDTNLENSYWDSETTLQTGTISGAIGLSTMAMQSISTHSGPLLLGPCFSLIMNKYPKLYTIENGACTNNLLSGPNETR